MAANASLKRERVESANDATRDEEGLRPPKRVKTARTEPDTDSSSPSHPTHQPNREPAQGALNSASWAREQGIERTSVALSGSVTTAQSHSVSPRFVDGHIALEKEGKRCTTKATGGSSPNTATHIAKRVEAADDYGPQAEEISVRHRPNEGKVFREEHSPDSKPTLSSNGNHTSPHDLDGATRTSTADGLSNLVQACLDKYGYVKASNMSPDQPQDSHDAGAVTESLMRIYRDWVGTTPSSAGSLQPKGPPGFKAFHAHGETCENKELYTNGEARMIQCFDGSKPVLALLLSHTLGQWYKTCVELSRRHFSLENQAKGATEKIQTKKNAAVASYSDAIKQIQQLDAHVAEGKIDRTESRMRFDRLRKVHNKALRQLEMLSWAEGDIRSQVKRAEDEWSKYMSSISVIHEDVLVECGLLPDFGIEVEEEDGEQCPTAGGAAMPITEQEEQPSEQQVQNCTPIDTHQPEERQSDHPATYVAPQPETAFARTTSPTNTRRDTHLAELPDEAKRDKLWAMFFETRGAAVSACKAYENHRVSYCKDLERYISEQRGHREDADFETEFGPIHVLRGQEIIKRFRDAEEAYEIAKENARAAGITFITGDLDIEYLSSLVGCDNAVPTSKVQSNDLIQMWMKDVDSREPVRTCPTLPPSEPCEDSSADEFDNQGSDAEDRGKMQDEPALRAPNPVTDPAPSNAAIQPKYSKVNRNPEPTHSSGLNVFTDDDWAAISGSPSNGDVANANSKFDVAKPATDHFGHSQPEVKAQHDQEFDIDIYGDWNSLHEEAVTSNAEHEESFRGPAVPGEGPSTRWHSILQEPRDQDIGITSSPAPEERNLPSNTPVERPSHTEAEHKPRQELQKNESLKLSLEQPRETTKTVEPQEDRTLSSDLPPGEPQPITGKRKRWIGDEGYFSTMDQTITNEDGEPKLVQSPTKRTRAGD
ncbi:hypothetical protein BU26DRAFT_571000 [Trematosphaeria pertusa]|uniref:Uncharacterized protein n=1 Tax=Trematosphaeria pertusa TaxID=390896 RepID=A0A6A6HY74_9PLEO|nr:uncharacterized protein BU26DRAFT_571000 [Trematosphaeria pertusa]KAF2242320.1 hypothetical protein BU26DRAFT_571000 [Trematosphaeria pertusa]